MCSYAHPGHYHDGAAYCAARGQPKAGRTPTRKRPGSERPTPLPKRTKARATQARPQSGCRRRNGSITQEAGKACSACPHTHTHLPVLTLTRSDIRGGIYN